MDDFVEDHGFCRALGDAQAAPAAFEPHFLAPQWHADVPTRDACMFSLSAAYLRSDYAGAWRHALRLAAVLAPGAPFAEAVRAMRRDEAEAAMLCALEAGARDAAAACCAFLEAMRRSDGHTAALLSSVRSRLSERGSGTDVQ